MLTRIAALFFLLALPGCYVKGREGYICKSTSDCDPGLTCRTFNHRRDTRQVCVPPGTTSVGSKSTYTQFGVYAAWVSTFLLPVGIGGLVIKERLNKKRAARRG